MISFFLVKPTSFPTFQVQHLEMRDELLPFEPTGKNIRSFQFYNNMCKTVHLIEHNVDIKPVGPLYELQPVEKIVSELTVQKELAPSEIHVTQRKIIFTSGRKVNGSTCTKVNCLAEDQTPATRVTVSHPQQRFDYVELSRESELSPYPGSY